MQSSNSEDMIDTTTSDYNRASSDHLIIPQEILDRYYGPQNLLILTMSKTEQQAEIRFNLILKEAYIQLFQDDLLFDIRRKS